MQVLMRHTSRCGNWSEFRREIEDVLIDTLLCHPGWDLVPPPLFLRVGIALDLLPDSADDPEFLELSNRLQEAGLCHVFHTRPGLAQHEVRLEISQSRQKSSNHRNHNMKPQANLFSRLFRRNSAPRKDQPVILPSVGTLSEVGNLFRQGMEQFIAECVNPIHELAPDTYYSIKLLRIGTDEATAAYFNAYNKLPLQARIKFAQASLKNAAKSDCLKFEQFAGVAFVPVEELAEEQVLRLSAWDGYSEIYFSPEGEYPDFSTSAPRQTQVTQALRLVPRDGEQPTGPQETQINTQINRETQINPTQPQVNLQKFINGRETVLLSSAKPKLLARLSVKPYGGKEQSVEITRLPFSLGREPEPNGYNLAPDEAPPGTGLRCSRQHLSIEEIDANGHFVLRNHAVSRNGSYDELGNKLPEKFLLKSGGWINLGGQDEGTVKIRLEAVA